MVICVVTSICSFLGFLLQSLIVACRLSEKENFSKIIPHIIWAFATLICFMLSATWVCYSDTISNPEAIVITDSIYQEINTGEYFAKKVNNWNPTQPTYRVYLDKEVVEEYVETYNKLNALESIIKEN